jgi:hypothetical protein
MKQANTSARRDTYNFAEIRTNSFPMCPNGIHVHEGHAEYLKERSSIAEQRIERVVHVSAQTEPPK